MPIAPAINPTDIMPDLEQRHRDAMLDLVLAWGSLGHLDPANHLFRRVLVAIIGEADDIAEQDRNILEPAGPHDIRRFQFVDGGGRQCRMEQIVCTLLLDLDLLEIACLLIPKPFFLQAGMNARPKECRVEWLWQMVLGAAFYATDDAVHLVHCGNHDDRNLPEPHVRLDSLQRLLAVEDRHHDVQENQVERLFGGAVEGLLPVLREGHVGVALALEPTHQRVPVVFVVIDHKEGRLVLGHGADLSFSNDLIFSSSRGISTGLGSKSSQPALSALARS